MQVITFQSGAAVLNKKKLSNNDFKWTFLNDMASSKLELILFVLQSQTRGKFSKIKIFSINFIFAEDIYSNSLFFCVSDFVGKLFKL